MTMKPPPHILYKYQKFNTNNLESLCLDLLFYADPSTYNDPLECRPTVKCDSELPELRHLYARLVFDRIWLETISSLNVANTEEKTRNSHADHRANKSSSDALRDIAYHATNPDYGENRDENEQNLALQGIEREVRTRVQQGVCCFSTDYDNTLLWSHYSENHTGICVGYNLDRKPAPEVREVVYGDNRSISTSLMVQAFVERDSHSMTVLNDLVLLRKSAAWSYESEWRLIGEKGSNQSPLALIDVTFGLRCPESVKYIIINVLKQREKEPLFYEIYTEDHKYVLSRRHVETDEMFHFLPRTARSGVEIFGDSLTGSEIPPK